MMRSLIYALSALAVTGTAWAEPAHPFDSDPTEALSILEAPSRSCEARSGVCLLPGARSTSAAESAAVAAASPHRKTATAPTVISRFARATPQGSWSVEVDALLKRAAVAGNALFILFDTEDAHAVENHEYTAMYQTSIRAGRTLAARLTFHPDEGFRAGHNYRLRVVQLLGGKEVVLAEVDVGLL
jgi:hypothetical protein